MKDYRFFAEVYDDISSTVEWLEERRDGLGLEFESAFFSAVQTARSRPESFATDGTGYRPVRLEKFSAVMNFAIEDEVIVVAGVFMGGRSESNLEERG